MADNSLWIHFTYDEPLAIQEFVKLLNFVDKSFSNALDVISIKNHDSSISSKKPVRILEVNNGSILIDFLFEALTAIGIEVIKSIFEVLKKRFASKNKQVGDVIYNNEHQINIHVGRDLIIPSKIDWGKVEEEKFVRKAIETYVKNKLNIPADEFIRDVDFIDLISLHGLGSLKIKLQNIKAVLEELKIENSLDISGLSNYSKTNKDFILGLLR